MYKLLNENGSYLNVLKLVDMELVPVMCVHVLQVGSLVIALIVHVVNRVAMCT
jgi:hypothetical protein